MHNKARVIIVGGGGTGIAIAHDLALRGFKPLLIERASITAGTTGRHHGLLHSGARYVTTDISVAQECWQECQILRRITSNVIEDNGGLYIQIGDTNLEYEDNFVAGCQQIGIPIKYLTKSELLHLEPHLNPKVQYGYWVPDASFDAYRLPLQFLATAQHNGAVVRQFCQLVAIETQAGAVHQVRILDQVHHKEETLPCDILINATGVWGNEVARQAGTSVDITWDSGLMLAIQQRMVSMVINRLAPPGDADIIVPQRLLNIIGATNRSEQVPDSTQIDSQETQKLLHNANQMVRGFSQHQVYAVWRATRPLAKGKGDHAQMSRKTVCINHNNEGGPSGMLSIIGGKATTLRAMAQTLSTMVCDILGSATPCSTHEVPLLHFHEYRSGQKSA